MKIEMKDGKTYIDGKLVNDTGEMGPITFTDGRNTTSIGKITSGGSASSSKLDNAMKGMKAQMEAATRARAEAARSRAGTGAAGVRIEGMRSAGGAGITVDGKPIDFEKGEGVTTNPDGSKNITIQGEGAVIYFGGGKRK